MMFVGYARVSLPEQQLALQEDALQQAGCERIYTDTASSTQMDRPGLTRALEFLRAGATLMVWKLDRLGRSLSHLVAVVNDLHRQGVHFRSLQEQIDTTSGVGKLVFHLFAALAEFEHDLIRERTCAGFAAARARGKCGGRPKVLDAKQTALARALYHAQELPVREICSLLRIGKTTFYRYLKGAESSDQDEQG
jgi:DNA invertase Pin-like site-specific DNA recombinase